MVATLQLIEILIIIGIFSLIIFVKFQKNIKRIWIIIKYNISGKKEVIEAFLLLEKLHQQFNDNGFGTIRTQIEKSIFSDTNRFIALTKTKSVKICVISMVGNMAGDMVESGQYHIYRGFLNPMGPGRNLLKIFNFAMDELLQLGDIDQAFAETQKKAILANIKNVG